MSNQWNIHSLLGFIAHTVGTAVPKVEACCCYLGQFVLFSPVFSLFWLGDVSVEMHHFHLTFFIILYNDLHSWAKHGINCLWNHHIPIIFCVSTLCFCYIKYDLFSWFEHHSVKCLPNYPSKFCSCGSSLNFLGVHFLAMILHCLSGIAQCFSCFLFSDVDNIIPLTEWFASWGSTDVFQIGLPAHGKLWICADTSAAVLWGCIAEPDVSVWIPFCCGSLAAGNPEKSFTASHSTALDTAHWIRVTTIGHFISVWHGLV